jgi:hypothetical protein
MRIPFVTEAVKLWRLWPTQIESGLSRYHRRSIGEWLRRDFTMSSRELLVLLDELPDESRFREAAERTFHVAEHKGQLLRVRAAGRPPTDVKIVATYTDWTFDRKLLARNTRELAAMRADHRSDAPDLSALVEPLDQILAERAAKERAELKADGQSRIHAGLYAYER